MRTVRERVTSGIRWLDNSDKVPTNWRSLLKLDELKFANPDYGPVGQLFDNDYRKAMQVMRMWDGAQLGFCSQYKLKEDPASLKAEWANQLRTDKSWEKLGNQITRKIKGVRFILYWDWHPTDNRKKLVKVMTYRSGIAQILPRSYCSYDSAMRCDTQAFTQFVKVLAGEHH